MLEATGEITHDESKNHIIATRHGTGTVPLWMQLSAGRYGIELRNIRFGGAWIGQQYLDAPAATTAALDFTTTDYSLAIWFYWGWVGYSAILFGKYAVDVSGWEVYLHQAGGVETLTVRHHHGGTRTATYSEGWVTSQWHLWSYSRIGVAAYHYRDGELIPTIGPALQDPASSAADDLIIGKRYTGDMNYLSGRIYRPRAWSRALSADEHRLLYRLGYP